MARNTQWKSNKKGLSQPTLSPGKEIRGAQNGELKYINILNGVVVVSSSTSTG